MCVTETFETPMNTWNTNTAALANMEAEAHPPAPRALRPASKSLYVAPPRFDIEGWIFIATLTVFAASLAVLVLAK